MRYTNIYYAALVVLALAFPFPAASQENSSAEEFTQFLAKFSRIKEFQLSRIDDPLQSVTVIAAEDFKRIEETVPLEVLRLNPHPVMPKLGDYYQSMIIEISKSERKVLVQSRESDLYVKDFIFRLNGCCWRLIRTEERAY